jgi:hypothetical protein
VLNRSRRVVRTIGAVCLAVVIATAPQVSAQTDDGSTTPSTPQETPSERMSAKPVREVLNEAQRTRLPSAALGSEIEELAADPTAYMDANGYFFHLEPEPSSSAEPDELAERGVDAPIGDAFQLSSKPGASKTIFIDFDGATTTGTVWNLYEGVTSKTTTPFDRDGNPSSFSASELDSIRAIWQTVAEDFAPFDVNVTTSQPTDSALFADFVGDPVHGTTSVVTTEKWLRSTQLACQAGCGGIAYIDIFGKGSIISSGSIGAGTRVDRFYGTAWAFPSTSTSLAYTASTISHEVGHNLGLRHDGTATASYYSGHGDWGPIMGSSSRTYTQWSRGEYAGANQPQDDTAIIQTKLGSRSDESSSFASAVFLNNDGARSSDQVITSPSDIDYFAVSAPYGYLEVDLRKSFFGYNLLPNVTIYDSTFTQRTSGLVNPSTGTVAVSGLSPGTHYIAVSSAGSGDPTVAFSSYGSLGYYNLGVGVLAAPSPITGITTQGTGNRAVRATWTQPSSLSPLAPFTYEVEWCNALTGLCNAPVKTANTYSDFATPPDGPYYPRINANHLNGRSSGTVNGPQAALVAPGAPVIQRVVWNDEADTVRVDWSRGAEYLPIGLSGATISISDGSSTRSEVVTGSSGSVVFQNVSWSNTNMQVSGYSTSDYPSPYDRGAAVSANVFLGRAGTPQTPGTGGTGRPTVPQTPGSTGGGRPSVPQA